MGTRCADHVTPLYPQKLALTSPTGGGRSVGKVRSRTKATGFSLVYGDIHMKTCGNVRVFFITFVRFCLQNSCLLGYLLHGVRC